MKKILNISVIAALAILPMAARAEVGDVIDVNDPAHDDNAAAAQTLPKYALAVEAANDDKVVTASYVKGAYNAAIKAINAVSTTADNAVKGVQVNGTDLPLTNGKANITVTTGDSTSGNGTIKVNGAPVSVYGLGTAAYVNTDAIAGTTGTYNNSNSGLSTNTIQGAIDTVEGRVDTLETQMGNTTLTTTKQNVTEAINELDSAIDGLTTDYAKRTGVTATISSSTVTVPALATWGSTNTTDVAASITGATYTETAPATPGQ